MLSPFQLHQERQKQRQDKIRLATLNASLEQDQVTTATDTSLITIRQRVDTYEVALEDDLKRLKDLNTAQKVQLKKQELIPKYQALTNEIIQSEHTIQTPLCGWVLIWLCDCGQFDDAFSLAKQLLTRGQELPVKRDIPTFMSDALKEWANQELAQGNAINPYVNDLLTLVENEPAWAIHDKSRAELYKLLGLQAYAAEAWQEAVDHFTTAQALDEAVGVKTKLATAEKALAKQAQA